MTQPQICQFCQGRFVGRSNQQYCSNAHKVKAFRARATHERLSVAKTRQPVFFLFSSPLPYHVRQAPQICRELNTLHMAITFIKQTLSLEGTWDYTDGKLFFRQEIQSLRQEADRIQEKIQQAAYSEQFRQFMGPNLLAIARLYRQIARQMGRMQRSFPKGSLLPILDVYLDPSFVAKMHKAQIKYSKLWCDYKNKYLLNV